MFWRSDLRKLFRSLRTYVIWDLILKTQLKTLRIEDNVCYNLDTYNNKLLSCYLTHKCCCYYYYYYLFFWLPHFTHGKTHYLRFLQSVNFKNLELQKCFLVHRHEKKCTRQTDFENVCNQV